MMVLDCLPVQESAGHPGARSYTVQRRHTGGTTGYLGTASRYNTPRASAGKEL